MPELADKKCVACEIGSTPLTTDAIQQHLTAVPEWSCVDNQDKIVRKFSFKGFLSTMNFVNAVAWIAQQEKHHPDIQLGYNYCHVTFQTHAANGLTENDFICAAKIDRLFEY